MSKINKNGNAKQGFDIYQMVTNQIIEILENHQNLEYSTTWTPKSGEVLANNPETGTIYRGMNQLILCFITTEKGYTQNRYLTMKQGNKHGAKLIKGSKGCPITYLDFKYIDEKGINLTREVKEILKNGGQIPEGYSEIPYLKYYYVYNIEQFESLPEKLKFKGEILSFTEPEKDEIAEEILNKSGAKIIYVPFSENAFTIAAGQKSPNFYNYKSDIIQLAARDQFKGIDAFYKSAFHELGHWTGHPKRLNRNLGKPFGTPEYALEELTAELFSAFISAGCGFASNITRNAAYIKSWLTCLKNDKKFIFSAAGSAQKAADFLGEIIDKKLGKPSKIIQK